MTVRATWHGAVIAESDATVIVEGNHYFPPESIRQEFFSGSETHTSCPWKGEASYFSVAVDGESNPDAAWTYTDPYAAAEAIRDYVAFWKGVEVSAEPGDGTPGPSPPPR